MDHSHFPRLLQAELYIHREKGRVIMLANSSELILWKRICLFNLGISEPSYPHLHASNK